MAVDSTSDIFRKLARRYRTPEAVQFFLKSLTYNKEKNGETVQSAAKVLQTKKAHCLEASILSAAILEHQGYPPLILSLDSIDHLCHAVFVFKTKTGWGAVAKSREIGLHGRAPRFRSLRDLVWSYYDPFIDKTGKITAYTLLNLNDSETDWRFSKQNLWKLEKFVVYAKHTKLKSSQKRYLTAYHQYIKTGATPKNGKHWW
jgi:hypothetical protein